MNLLNLFRPRKDLSILDISYLRHDPETKTLILYNNASQSVKKVRLVVINKEKQSFVKEFERLGPHSSESVPLSNLTDSTGKPFNGEILKIVFHLNDLKTTFEPDNKKFKRKT